jgi:hypothetical protein
LKRGTITVCDRKRLEAKARSFYVSGGTTAR